MKCGSINKFVKKISQTILSFKELNSMKKFKFTSVFLVIAIILNSFYIVQGISIKTNKDIDIKFDTDVFLKQKNKIIKQIEKNLLPHNDYIITLRDDTTPNDITNHKKHNLKVASKSINSYKLSSDKTSILELLKDDDIISIEFDNTVNANSTDESEKNFSEDYAWNLKMINADFDTTTKSYVKIAIIDSGVSPHLDLNIKEHVDFTNDNTFIPILNDNSGHGTGIAGIINCQPDSRGYIGINPSAEIYSLKVLDSNNSAKVSTVIEAIEWCINNDINIINMSFGMDESSVALHHIINKAYQNNIIMVASSGNNGTVQYPAKYEEVISVGSVDSNGSLSEFSATAEIMAPGEAVCSTALFEGYSEYNGTSYSAAHVTGAISRLVAIDKTKSVAFIRNLLKTCASTNEFGINILNLKNCIDNYQYFSEIYTDTSEITHLQESDVNYYYDTSGIVVGSWSGTRHRELVDDTNASTLLTNLNSSLSAKHLELLKICSALPDEYIEFEVNGEITTYKDCLGLHGYHKYVANLNYIYTVAYNYFARDTFASGDERIEHPIATVSLNNVSTGIKQAILNLVNTSVLDNFSETHHHTKAIKILGFALHLAGDIHAHRTRVPTTTLDQSNPTVKNRINVNHFNAGGACPNLNNTTLLKSNAQTSSVLANSHTCYDCFEKTVKNYWMEFRDLKYYVKSSFRSDSHSLYIDNINYYSSRFNHGSSVLVKLLTKNLLSGNQFNVKWMFHCLYTGTYDNNFTYTIKLNNLVNYCKQVNSNITYTDAMKNNSTSYYI